jgi:hypothetical protein
VGCSRRSSNLVFGGRTCTGRPSTLCFLPTTRPAECPWFPVILSAVISWSPTDLPLALCAAVLSRSPTTLCCGALVVTVRRMPLVHRRRILPRTALYRVLDRLIRRRCAFFQRRDQRDARDSPSLYLRYFCAHRLSSFKHSVLRCYGCHRLIY